MEVCRWNWFREITVNYSKIIFLLNLYFSFYLVFQDFLELWFWKIRNRNWFLPRPRARIPNSPACFPSNIYIIYDNLMFFFRKFFTTSYPIIFRSLLYEFYCFLNKYSLSLVSVSSHQTYGGRPLERLLETLCSLRPTLLVCFRLTKILPRFVSKPQAPFVKFTKCFSFSYNPKARWILQMVMVRCW